MTLRSFFGLMIFLMVVFGGLVIFGNLQEKNLPKIEKAPLKAEIKTVAEALVPKKKNDVSEKIAKGISYKIAESIRNLNPDGPEQTTEEDGQTNETIKALNQEKIVNEVIAGELASIDQVDLGFNQIKLKPFKIANFDTKEAKIKYLKDLQEILQNNFRNKAVNWTDPKDSDLTLIAVSYQKTLNEVEKIEVPISLLVIHEQEVRLLNEQKIIFNKIADVNNDPITAAAALKKLPEVNKGFSELNDNIKLFAAKYSLGA